VKIEPASRASSLPPSLPQRSERRRKDATETTPKIVVTGHSLGGAIATVGAFTLMHVHGYDIERVVTFGEPRDGDTNFASIYGLNTEIST